MDRKSAEKEPLNEIVTYLRSKYLENRSNYYDVERVLSLTSGCPNLIVQQWVINHGIHQHPRIEVLRERRVRYIPPLPPSIQCEDTLLAYVKKQYDENRGGVLRSEIDDTVSASHRIIKNLLMEEKIIVISNVDKSEVIFYNFDINSKIHISPNVRAFWQATDANIPQSMFSKIDEYLMKKKLSPVTVSASQGIRKVVTTTKAPTTTTSRTKIMKPRQRGLESQKFKNNQHVSGILNQYDLKSENVVLK